MKSGNVCFVAILCLLISSIIHSSAASQFSEDPGQTEDTHDFSERADPLKCAWDLAKFGAKFTPFSDWFKAGSTTLSLFNTGIALATGDVGDAAQGALGLGFSFANDVLKAALEAGKAAAKTAVPILKLADLTSYASDIKTLLQDCWPDPSETSESSVASSSSSAVATSSSSTKTSTAGTSNGVSGGSTTGCATSSSSSSSSGKVTSSGASASGSGTTASGSVSGSGSTGAQPVSGSTSSGKVSSSTSTSARAKREIYAVNPCGSGSSVSSASSVSASASDSASGTVSGSPSGTDSSSNTATNTNTGTLSNDPTLRLDPLKLLTAAMQVKREFECVYQVVQFLIDFFGNSQWVYAAQNADDAEQLVLFMQAFSEQTALTTNHILTPAAYNTLLAMPMFLSSVDVAAFLTRYNNTINYALNGWTTATVPTGYSQNFFDSTQVKQYATTINQCILGWKNRGMTENSPNYSSFFQEAMFKYEDAAQAVACTQGNCAAVDVTISADAINGVAKKRDFQFSVADSLDIKPYRVLFGKQATTETTGVVKQRIRFLDVPGYPTSDMIVSWFLTAGENTVGNSGFQLPPPDQAGASSITFLAVEPVVEAVSAVNHMRASLVVLIASIVLTLWL